MFTKYTKPADHLIYPTKEKVARKCKYLFCNSNQSLSIYKHGAISKDEFEDVWSLFYEMSVDLCRMIVF